MMMIFFYQLMANDTYKRALADDSGHLTLPARLAAGAAAGMARASFPPLFWAPLCFGALPEQSATLPLRPLCKVDLQSGCHFVQGPQCFGLHFALGLSPPRLGAFPSASWGFLAVLHY